MNFCFALFQQVCCFAGFVFAFFVFCFLRDRFFVLILKVSSCSLLFFSLLCPPCPIKHVSNFVTKALYPIVVARFSFLFFLSMFAM